LPLRQKRYPLSDNGLRMSRRPPGLRDRAFLTDDPRVLITRRSQVQILPPLPCIYAIVLRDGRSIYIVMRRRLLCSPRMSGACRLSAGRWPARELRLPYSTSPYVSCLPCDSPLRLTTSRPVLCERIYNERGSTLARTMLQLQQIRNLTDHG